MSLINKEWEREAGHDYLIMQPASGSKSLLKHRAQGEKIMIGVWQCRQHDAGVKSMGVWNPSDVGFGDPAQLLPATVVHEAFPAPASILLLSDFSNLPHAYMPTREHAHHNQVY